MIHFDFWDTVLVCMFLVFYYGWPFLVIIDGVVIYWTVKFIKQKKYKRLLFLIPVAVLLSGPLIYFLIQWLEIWIY